MQLQPIATIHNDFKQKFGIPRQSGLAPHVHSRIVFEPEFTVADALRGIEGFSHLWLIWQFDRAVRNAKANSSNNICKKSGTEACVSNGVSKESGTGASVSKDVSKKDEAGARVSKDVSKGTRTSENVSEACRKTGAKTCNSNDIHKSPDRSHAQTSWHPTVRPPRLGGNERAGVFATRSPFRPNSLGLSVVELERVEWQTAVGPILHVLGADIMDGTPIFDIKPYLPYADAHPSARSGFVEHAELNAKESSENKAEKIEQKKSQTDVRKNKPDEKLNEKSGKKQTQNEQIFFSPSSPNSTSHMLFPQSFLEVKIPENVSSHIPANKVEALTEVLSCDPRPAYHNDPQRTYSMVFGDMDVSFKVGGNILSVTKVTNAQN